MSVTKIIDTINNALLDNHLEINAGYSISCNTSNIEIKLSDFQVDVDFEDNTIYVAMDTEYAHQHQTKNKLYLSFDDTCKTRYFDWFIREGIYHLRSLVDAMKALPEDKVKIVEGKYNNLFINGNKHKVSKFILKLGERPDFGGVPITAFVEIGHNNKHRYYIDLTNSEESIQVEFLKLADIVK